MRACSSDRISNRLAFMATQIVHDDDVIGPQLRHQMLGDVVLEDFTVHRPIEYQGRDDAVVTQTGNKCGGAPVPVWSTADQALPTSAASMASMHVGLGPGLIDKDQALGIKAMLIITPSLTCGGDVRTVLLVRQHGFF